MIIHIKYYLISSITQINIKNINSQNFVKFCRSILSAHDYNLLKMNIDDFEYIYDNISAMSQ